MLKPIVALGLFVLLLGGLLLWMAGGIQKVRSFESELRHVPSSHASANPAGPELRVVTWNIAWGFGFGSEGSKSPGEKSAADIRRAIEDMGEKLRSLGADIALIQEIDFDAGRSYGIDQARVLAEASGLSHIAPAVSWKAGYIPFPYWPPSAHFGHMSSGGAVLSRFPIKRCRVQLLPKPSAYPFWYRAFYLFRFAQDCELDVGGKPLRVVNMHLEAFEEANRVAQAKLVAQMLVESEAKRAIFGGDLNSIPPESPVSSGYPDEPGTDHQGDTTIPTFRKIAGFRPAIAPDQFNAGPEAFYTFPAHAPNRKLDHLFISESLTSTQARVVSEAGALSDHLPVLVHIQLGD
jgi:endonuclease/exonuclease/phosphatase family metal-dependent hydrolase